MVVVFCYTLGKIYHQNLSIENVIEAFFVEINLYKKKWIISCSYNPNKALIANHMAVLSKDIDIYVINYDNLLFWGDFKAGF